MAFRVAPTAEGAPLQKPTWIMSDMPGCQEGLGVKWTKALRQKLSKRKKTQVFYTVVKTGKKISVTGKKALAATAKLPLKFCRAVYKVWMQQGQK